MNERGGRRERRGDKLNTRVAWLAVDEDTRMIERCYFKFSVGAVPSCPNRLSTIPGGVGSQATPRTRCADVRALRDAEEDRDGDEKHGGRRNDDRGPPADEIRPFCTTRFARRNHTPLEGLDSKRFTLS